MKEIKLSELLDTLEKEVFAKRNPGKADRVRWLVKEVIIRLDRIKDQFE